MCQDIGRLVQHCLMSLSRNFTQWRCHHIVSKEVQNLGHTYMLFSALCIEFTGQGHGLLYRPGAMPAMRRRAVGLMIVDVLTEDTGLRLLLNAGLWVQRSLMSVLRTQGYACY
jgi:hypothetical protein